MPPKTERPRPLAFASLVTPRGKLLVVASPKGICRVVNGRVRTLKNSKSTGPGQRQKRMLAKAVLELREYYLGRRKRFTVAVDISEGTAFQQKVWRKLRRVPYGSVITYGELARRVGRPGGARAVGQAVGSNPIGIIIPCHRIVASGGRIGGWSGGGGIEGKKALLRIEGVFDISKSWMMKKKK